MLRNLLSLFSLPRELRDQIFSYVFSHPITIPLTLTTTERKIKDTIDIYQTNDLQRASKTSISHICDVPLLTTCTQARAEARPIFYQSLVALLEVALFVFRIDEPLEIPNLRTQMSLLERVKRLEIRLDFFASRESSFTSDRKSTMFGNMYDTVRKISSVVRQNQLNECNFTVVGGEDQVSAFGSHWESFTHATIIRLMGLNIRLSSLVNGPESTSWRVVSTFLNASLRFWVVLRHLALSVL